MVRKRKTNIQSDAESHTQVEITEPNDETQDASKSLAEKLTPELSSHHTMTQPTGHRLVMGTKGLAKWYWHKKLWTLPVTLLVLLLLDLVMPIGGYPVLGSVVKTPTTFSIIDSVTGRPIASAAIQFGDTTAHTSAAGIATLNLPIGHITVQVDKPYYAASSLTMWSVPRGSHHAIIHLVATGRQVPITVVNRISGKPVEGAAVKVLNAETITDKKGQAIIVLPIGAATQKGTVSCKGYNDTGITITVTDVVVADNTYQITPAGTVYFLSNLSGKIDVVKTNLDGSGRRTVVAGTGQESPYDTVLLASRDWKYLALYSKRNVDGNPEINLIDTSNDKVSNIDEGNANFTIIGWAGDSFVYIVDRTNIKPWQNKHEVLKSFDAPHKSIAILAETAAGGNQHSYTYQFFNAFILDGEVMYLTEWNSSNSSYYYDNGFSLNGKSATVHTVFTDGSHNTTVKSFALGFRINFGIYSAYAEPNAIVLQYTRSSGTDYYEFRDGKLTAMKDLTELQSNYNSSTTYLQSPSGSQAFWRKPADGKFTLYVGNKYGDNGNQIAQLTDYAPYGWYTDNYVLVSKNGSELYIMPVAGGNALRITDYFKPSQYYNGYGGGYGGGL